MELRGVGLHGGLAENLALILVQPREKGRCGEHRARHTAVGLDRRPQPAQARAGPAATPQHLAPVTPYLTGQRLSLRRPHRGLHLAV